MTVKSDALVAEFATALRAYATAGDNTSGVHNPGKDALLTALTNLLAYTAALETGMRVSGGFEFAATKTALDAITPSTGEGTPGLVYADGTASNNGFYIYSSSTWTQMGDDVIPASLLTTITTAVSDAETAQAAAEVFKDDAETAAASVNYKIATVSVTDNVITLTTGASLSSLTDHQIFDFLLEADVTGPKIEVDSVTGEKDLADGEGSDIGILRAGSHSIMWDDDNSRFALRGGGDDPEVRTTLLNQSGNTLINDIGERFARGRQPGARHRE